MSDKKDSIHSIFGPELDKVKEDFEKTKAYKVKKFVGFVRKNCTDQEILEIFLEMLPSANVETCGMDHEGDDDIEQFVVYTGVVTK